MSEHIHQIAAEMSPFVLAAEEANEASMIALCNLLAATAMKRREVGVLPAETQPDYMRLHQALGQTISAQSAVLRFHGRLEDQYRVLAADDIHSLTVEGVQRSAEVANRHRQSPARVVKLSA